MAAFVATLALFSWREWRSGARSIDAPAARAFHLAAAPAAPAAPQVAPVTAVAVVHPASEGAASDPSPERADAEPARRDLRSGRGSRTR